MSSFFSPYSQARFKALAEKDRDGLLTFKDSKGMAQNAEPIPCAVAPDTAKPATETQQSERVVSITYWKIKVPLSTAYNAAWRAIVTYPSGEEVQYFLKAGEGPYSNASQLVLLATKVN